MRKTYPLTDLFTDLFTNLLTKSGKITKGCQMKIRARQFVPLSAAAFPLMAILLAPAASQTPPPSALINQQSQETVEAARAASPHHL